MNILLTTLNSKFVHSNLALRYLYTTIKDCNVPVELQEFTINNEESYIYGELVRAKCELLCFSCYIWNIEKTLSLCENLKKARPKLKILLGGPEVSYGTQELLHNHPYIDYVAIGEGEKIFKDISNTIHNNDSLENVPNLITRENMLNYVTACNDAFDFNNAPFPYKYLPIEKNKVIYYESSRGCPYSCAYCISSIDKKVRPLDIARVKTELGYFIKQSPKQVKFIDRTFNFDKRRTKEIWEYIINNDNGTTNFHFEICADLLDNDLINLLKEAREELFQLEIGIQSTNPKTLESVNRNSKTENLISNTKEVLKQNNIHIHVDLIAGLPYEDINTFKKSFNDVYEIGAHNLQLGFLKVLKGTLIRNMPEHSYVYRSKAPYEIISNAYMSAEELVRVKMIENTLDMYYNKTGFRKSLSQIIHKLDTLPFDFYDILARYFYSHGFANRSHKKEDLYRILYKFACSQGELNVHIDEIKGIISSDLEEHMNFDAVKKFNKKGWEIN